MAAYLARLELDINAQVDDSGRVNVGSAHPWLLQLHSDFDDLFAVVDDLNLDAQIVSGRYALFFQPPGSDEPLNQSIQHVADFDLSSVKPIFLD